jgi:hypothetical protein
MTNACNHVGVTTIELAFLFTVHSATIKTQELLSYIHGLISTGIPFPAFSTSATVSYLNFLKS